MLPKIISLLFASGDSLSIKEIAKLTTSTEEEILHAIPSVREYVVQGGLSLLEDGNELQIVTSKEQSELVTSLLKKDLEGELTPATLQVLTIIAYLGKVTRADISFIRGVQSSQSIRTLSVRGLIVRSGEECSLTPDALRYLGITNVEELPEYEALHAELSSKLAAAKEEL